MSGHEEPACWSWPVPALVTVQALTAEIEAANSALPRDERRDPRAAGYLLSDGGRRHQFEAFHAGRCAICLCGDDRLVDDHDHGSGLIRGLLCRGCNVAEGRSGHTIFEAYRRRPPAVILGYRKFYTGFGWYARWWENELAGRSLTGNPGWTRDGATLTP